MRVSSRRCVKSCQQDRYLQPPADGTLTFTFEGFSADDSDQMVFAFNGELYLPTRSLPWVT